MKKYRFIIIVFLFSFAYKEIKAQVHFESLLSWEEVKQKAQKENKLIFIDVYATYCMPCKQMDKEVFSLPKTGKFFNTNFVNVKLQLDSTNEDSPNIQHWRPVAYEINKKYKLSVVPTYLFMDSSGVLIHRIIGGNFNADNFIANSSLALDPAVQIKTVRAQYDLGDRSSSLLNSIRQIQRGLENDSSLALSKSKDPATLTNEYLNLLFTSFDDNCQEIKLLCLNHPQEVDAIRGRGVAASTLRRLVIDTEIYPMLSGGKRVTRNGLMEIRPDIKVLEPNWEMIEGYLLGVYPEYNKELLLAARRKYFSATGHSSNDMDLQLRMAQLYPDRMSFTDILELAYSILNSGSKNKNILSPALKITGEWMAYMKDDNTLWYPCAILMYRSGDRPQAIALIQQLKGRLSSVEQKKELERVVEKMKAGEVF